MRRSPTFAEQKMWGLLRKRRLLDLKFRRQVPIGPYIADFASYELKLIVELDGSQHAEDAGDSKRDADLARRGFKVLRVWNNDVLARPGAVIEAILAALEESP